MTSCKTCCKTNSVSYIYSMLPFRILKKNFHAVSECCGYVYPNTFTLASSCYFDAFCSTIRMQYLKQPFGLMLYSRHPISRTLKGLRKVRKIRQSGKPNASKITLFEQVFFTGGKGHSKSTGFSLQFSKCIIQVAPKRAVCNRKKAKRKNFM